MKIYLISICCCCHVVLGKVETTAFKKDTLSHGLCAACFKKEQAKVDRFIKEHKGE